MWSGVGGSVVGWSEGVTRHVTSVMFSVSEDCGGHATFSSSAMFNDSW